MNHELLLSPTNAPIRAGDTTISDLMHHFIAQLATDDGGVVLRLRLPLLTTWSTLHSLTGDVRSYRDAISLVLDLCDKRGDTQALSPLGSTVAGAFRALLDDLLDEGIPEPLSQPFTIGLVWADLCRLTGEKPPTVVLALLDDTVTV